jgi:hypothetical protein
MRERSRNRCGCLPFHHGRAPSAEEQNGQFFFDVDAEHHDPASVVEALAGRLKPGGQLLADPPQQLHR